MDKSMPCQDTHLQFRGQSPSCQNVRVYSKGCLVLAISLASQLEVCETYGVVVAPSSDCY